MKIDYCQLCKKRFDCTRASCHGEKIAVKGNLFNPLKKGAYVCDKDAENFALLLTTSRVLKKLDESVAGFVNVLILIVHYKGKAPRAVYDGFTVYKADIGKAGKKFVDIWLKEPLITHQQFTSVAGKYESVIRVSYDSCRAYLYCCKAQC